MLRARRPFGILFVALLACSGERSDARGEEAPVEPVPTTAVAPTATAAPTAPPAPFSADAAQPYFHKGVAKEAAAAYARESWQAARDGFDAALAEPEAKQDAAARGRLSFLRSLCDAALARWDTAAPGFDEAAAALPLLADYANYQAGRAYYFLRRYDLALERARRVGNTAVMDAEAELLVGDVLRAQGTTAEVVKQYQAYLTEYPRGMRLGEARYYLAEALEKSGRTYPDALELYRKVTLESPLDSWGTQAKQRFDALLPKAPAKVKARFAQMTASEYVARGLVYFEGMRNEPSEKDFTAALSAPGLDANLECTARYNRAQSVFKQRQRARSAPLFDEATVACAKTSNEDLQVKSVYQAGRGWYNSGDLAQAVARFERAETWHPAHSYADDARLRQAEVWEEMTEEPAPSKPLPVDAATADAKVTELLAKVPELYPSGDLKAEALWRLAWRAWKRGQYAEMITWLDKQMAAVPHDENYWAEGQPQYWKARALEKLGHPKQALASYEAGIREYPLSYYALLGLNRVRERDAGRFAKILGELRHAPKGWKKGTPAFAFAPRSVYGEPGFARALELLRLGLGAEAERELSRLGLRVPGGRSKVEDPDTSESLWATALLYDRAGRYDKSHWIARWSVLDYKAAWPTVANRERWDIAYPHAWWNLLEPAAKAQGYPAELLIAHVREESAFDPIRESFANAIGLTQMIMPTAKRFGATLGIPINRENLRDPAKNVAIGSRFLGKLWELFDGRVALTVPSYNAGEGAVWRWLCERGSWEQDEFAEEIPFDETRNYSKRVLSSYFTYRYLADGQVPKMENKIPAKAINKKVCKDGRPSTDRPGRAHK